VNTPLLSDLREPPVVGRYYLVPVVQDYPWHGRVNDWPVIGPKHTDARFFNFADEHYHLDLRFLTARQEAWAASCAGWHRMEGDRFRDGVIAVSGAPLTYRGKTLPKGRPELMRRKCRHVSYPSVLPDFNTAFHKLQDAYGAPAEAIRLDDGRVLCPHQKADLTQFPRDANGIVQCPLHGLRVRCAVPA